MILTDDRIAAAAHISRWNGWVKRPFSILDHSVIGAKVLQITGHTQADVRAFLLHDFHETEIIGDVPTPDKRKYCNSLYFIDVQEFDDRLMAETGVDLKRPAVAMMDKIMLEAEKIAVTTKNVTCNFDLTQTHYTCIEWITDRLYNPTAMFKELWNA